MPEEPTPEQRKALQEKMKNMSPEELKKLQKQQCVFCKIVEGEVNSKKIYEDDKCLAILDINPANPGHILLMPKEHYPLMPLIPEDIIGHLFIVAKNFSRIMLTAVNADGVDIFIANGSAAGQRAQHFMLHVIPRRTGDDIGLDISFKDHPKEKVEEAKQKITEKINAVFKVKKETLDKSSEKKKAKEPGKKKPAENKNIEEKSQEKEKKQETKKEESDKEEDSENVNLDEISDLLK